MIAGADIRLSGQSLDPALMDALIELRIEDSLALPDAFLIRIADPELKNMDTNPLEVGAEIEISLGAPDGEMVKMMSGQVASVEPEFAPTGVVIAARGYDHSHVLNRSRQTRTFQNMTAADIARKVISGSELQAGTVDDAGGVHDFVQQNNETDWEFLWRLARRLDFEVLAEDRKLHFRKAGSSASSPIDIRWGENLLSFRPRVTGVQQVDEVVVRGWNPTAKDVIESTAKAGTLNAQIGVGRSGVSSALGGGTLTVADRPVMTADEADALSASVVAQLANSYVEADGHCKGDPKLRAGTQIRVDGVGSRFGGTYTLTSTTHVFRGNKGYQTHVRSSGRSARSLLDLATPAARRGWGNSVVIGVVTQNDDPDKLGRVRVRYPALGDGSEGWWARVATPAAGKDRGLLMMPVVGDEVVIGFEHDDVRKPYVIGSLWNSKDTPGDLVQTDGSFGLQSDKKVAITAKDQITITGSKDLTIKTDGKVVSTATGDVSVEGQKVTIKGQSSITIEAQADLTIKAASLSLKASGAVQVSGASIMLG
jgi:phage protein D